MDSKNGYWQRQLYLLSSIGIFYLILIGMFAIPLLGTFVVILIKGALDLRYLILAAGCIAIMVIGVVAYKVARRMWHRFRRDGVMAGEEVRRSLLMGKPVEISVFNGLLKLSWGGKTAADRPALAQEGRALLPRQTDGHCVSGMLDQLQHLADLRRSGAIDADEYDLLKTMLIESSSSSCTTGGDPTGS